MGTVTALEAKTRFGELLERVARGEEIVITRHDKPVARMIPEGGSSLDTVRQAAQNLRKLSQEKLVRSFKGVHGGYELARPASSIRLSEILLVGRDGALMGDCVLGLSTCNDQDPCPLHARWKDVRDEIEKRVKNTRLSDLARNLKVHPGRRPKRPTLVNVQAAR